SAVLDADGALPAVEGDALALLAEEGLLRFQGEAAGRRAAPQPTPRAADAVLPVRVGLQRQLLDLVAGLDPQVAEAAGPGPRAQADAAGPQRVVAVLVGQD